jgi:hypothetical protein
MEKGAGAEQYPKSLSSRTRTMLILCLEIGPTAVVFWGEVVRFSKSILDLIFGEAEEYKVDRHLGSRSNVSVVLTYSHRGL